MTRDELKEEIRLAINTTRVLADITIRSRLDEVYYEDNPSYEERILLHMEYLNSLGIGYGRSALGNIKILIRDKRGYLRDAPMSKSQMDRAYAVLKKHCKRGMGGLMPPY